MLIDKSYFEGELKIPYDGKEWTEERLDIFIQQYEEELLRDLLGYGLYKAFMQGLEESAVAEKWQRLLTGAEYTRDGRLRKWDGLIHTMGGAAVQIIKAEPFDITVGGGEQYDPAPNTDIVLIPEAFRSLKFTFWQQGYGKLTANEYEIITDEDDPTIKRLKLLNWQFENESTYTYIATNSLSIDPASLTYRSLIANYVYWHWMADIQSGQSTPIGNTKSKAENSWNMDADDKMVNAWNQMSRMLKSFAEFMSENETDYEGWDDEQAAYVANKYYRTNILGI